MNLSVFLHECAHSICTRKHTSVVYVSHSRDDQRRRKEQSSQQASSAVRVLPLPLVHLAATVVAAAAHAEEEAGERHQDGEQQPHRRAN